MIPSAADGPKAHAPRPLLVPCGLVPEQPKTVPPWRLLMAATPRQPKTVPLRRLLNAAPSGSAAAGGHDGTSGGHDGTSGGHDGTSSGHDGTSGGHDGTSGGEVSPGVWVGRVPMTPIGARIRVPAKTAHPPAHPPCTSALDDQARRLLRAKASPYWRRKESKALEGKGSTTAVGTTSKAITGSNPSPIVIRPVPKARRRDPRRPPEQRASSFTSSATSTMLRRAMRAAARAMWRG